MHNHIIGLLKPKEKVDPEKLKEGAKIEREHTDDKDTAEVISSHHLEESPEYYKKLKIMEKVKLKDMKKLPKVEKGEIYKTSLKQTPFKSKDHPKFKEWFNGSKVVDEKGEPLTLYHGTRADIPSFDMKHSSGGVVGKGFYFSPDSKAASTYAESREGSNVIPVHVSIKNPIVYENYHDIPIGTPQDRYKSLIQMGYDGIIIKDGLNNKGASEYIAFHPHQIKSVYNNGEYNPNEPHISKSESEGYSFSKPYNTSNVSDSSFDPKKHRFSIEVTHPHPKAIGGKIVVGSIDVSHHPDGKIHTDLVEVHPEHRRKGLASELTNRAESASGKKMKPSYKVTEDGKKFWEGYSNKKIEKTELQKHDWTPNKDSPVHGMIDPKGNFHKLGPDEAHFDFARTKLQKPFFQAVKEGWVGIGHAGAADVTVHKKHLDNKLSPSVRKARELIGKHFPGQKMTVRVVSDTKAGQHPDVDMKFDQSVDAFDRHGAVRPFERFNKSETDSDDNVGPRPQHKDINDEESFIRYHKTGNLPPDEPDKHDWIYKSPNHTKDKFPILHDTFNSKTGKQIEFRANNTPLKYVKHNQGKIARDENGNALYLSQDEMKAKNLPLTDTTIHAYHGDKLVGGVDDSFGADDIFVHPEYQGEGIGSALLHTFRKQFPAHRQIGQMTEQGENLARSYYRKYVAPMNKSEFQKKHPFNPRKDISLEEREPVRKWLNVGDKESKQDIPRLEGNARARGLHKVAGWTKVRTNKDGEREYLLHRGIGPTEDIKFVDKDNNKINFHNQKELKSWTPDWQTAHNFSGEPYGTRVLSAWIPESQIHHVPMVIGTQEGPNTPYTKKEKEVLVNHSEPLNRLDTMEAFKMALPHLRSPKDVGTTRSVQAKDGYMDEKDVADIHHKINLKKTEEPKWKQEGYSIETGQDKHGHWSATAYSPKREVVGEAKFAHHLVPNKNDTALEQHPDFIKEWNNFVHPDHQRKGLASAMYEAVERDSGKKILPYGRTEEGLAFWSNPNRKFGNLTIHDKINLKPNPMNKSEDDDEDKLKGFRKKWQDKGVDNFAYHNTKKNHITLHTIIVPKEQRGQGVGSKYMKELNDYADKHGATVSLTPDTTHGGSSVSRLKSFYKKHGFVENKGRNKDYTISETMHRKPAVKKSETLFD